MIDLYTHAQSRLPLSFRCILCLMYFGEASSMQSLAADVQERILAFLHVCPSVSRVWRERAAMRALDSPAGVAAPLTPGLGPRLDPLSPEAELLFWESIWDRRSPRTPPGFTSSDSDDLNGYDSDDQGG